MLYKHSKQQPKIESTVGLAWARRRGKICCSPSSMRSASSPPNQTKPKCWPWGQPKQTTWNLTNHSHWLSTANKTNHWWPLIQTVLPRANFRKSPIQTANLRANFRKSSEITFGLLTPPSWQMPRDDDAAASTNCRPAAVPVQSSNRIYIT